MSRDEVRKFLNLSVQNLDVTEIPQAITLDAGNESTGWNENQILTSLNANHSCYKLLEHNELRGYCVARVVGDELEILNIVVGLENIFKQPSLFEAKHAWLEVREGNDAAIRLYENLGFEVSATRKNYYGSKGRDNTGRKEDALIMKRSLK